MTGMHTTIKNTFLLSLLCVFFSSVFFPLSAFGFFSDTEDAKEQVFTASELLFETTFDNQEVYVGPGLITEAVFTLPVAFTTSTIQNKYSFTVLETTGDTAFCDALALETSFNGSDSIGAFESFASSEYETSGEVAMSVHYDDIKRDIVHNSRCTAEIEVVAWQHNMSKETAGYRDTKTFSVTAIAHMVVLNEVLPRPNSTDTQVPNIEFIELYNNSDFAVDVLGWNITELTSGGLPTNHLVSNVSAAPASALVAYNGSYTTTVPAHGHLALRYRGSASYLNDTGDSITLIGNDGVAIDNYTFGAALVGKSDARIPDGVGAWVDPIPTPNDTNILEEDFVVVATSTASTTPTVFEEIAEQETVSTSTEEVASSTEPALPVEEVGIAPEETEVPEEEVFEDIVEEPVVEVVEEVEIEEVPNLPLSDTKDAKEVIQPEPVAKTTEEEVEIEEVVATDTE